MSRRERLSSISAIVLGVALSLAISGYHFGTSNHAVYLLDAMRRASPDLLANDWFTTQTVQYHALFGVMTAWLWRLGAIEPSFLVGYVLTAILFHVAWWRIVRTLGGGDATYLVSVLLFQISAGGTGLGMYQFLQDGEFLPSNLANVAMLWAIAMWIARRPAWAGALLGVAGVFHLNHAVVSIGLWTGLVLTRVILRYSEGSGPLAREARSFGVPQDDRQPRPRILRSIVFGTFACFVPCAINILYALIQMPRGAARAPLSEFVDLYVKLRHPHHYDPLSWPIGFWLTFLWPLPLAFVAWRQRRAESAWRDATIIALIFLFLQLVALLGAGVWYTSETLVQLSLFRFSIYPKLLTCIAAAFWLMDARPAIRRTLAIASSILLILSPVMLLLLQPRSPFGGVLAIFAVLSVIALATIARWIRPFAGALLAMVIVCIAMPRGWLGVNLVPEDGDDYLAMCRWVADPAHTPRDAVFLVPPDEQLFRPLAERAIVVNFKGVPQFSAELPIWRDRLQNVLELDDLRNIPRGWPVTFPYLRDRYDSRSAAHLIAVARKYGARFIVTRRPLDAPGLRFAHATLGHYLYDLGEQREGGDAR